MKNMISAIIRFFCLTINIISAVLLFGFNKLQFLRNILFCFFASEAAVPTVFLATVTVAAGACVSLLSVSSNPGLDLVAFVLICGLMLTAEVFLLRLVNTAAVFILGFILNFDYLTIPLLSLYEKTLSGYERQSNDAMSVNKAIYMVPNCLGSLNKLLFWVGRIVKTLIVPGCVFLCLFLTYQYVFLAGEEEIITSMEKIIAFIMYGGACLTGLVTGGSLKQAVELAYMDSVEIIDDVFAI